MQSSSPISPRLSGSINSVSTLTPLCLQIRGMRSSKWLGGSLNFYFSGKIGASIPPFGTKTSRPASGRKHFASGSPCLCYSHSHLFFLNPRILAIGKTAHILVADVQPPGEHELSPKIYFYPLIVTGSSESYVTILPSQLLQNDGEHRKTKGFQEHGSTRALHSLWSEFPDQKPCYVTV